MDPMCVFNFFTFFERVLYKSNCIIFIFSWCATHTKIRSKLVVIVTAGSQKKSPSGVLRGPPLGVLRVNFMQYESVATNSPLCGGYIESILVRTGIQFSGNMIWYKQFRSFCYRVEPSSLSLTGTKCKLLTTQNDSGSLLRRVCCYNRANRIYINHLQIAVYYTTPTDSLWEPPHQSPLKMTLWQGKTRRRNYICHSLQFVTVVLKVSGNLLRKYIRNEYLE